MHVMAYLKLNFLKSRFFFTFVTEATNNYNFPWAIKLIEISINEFS